MATKDEHRAGLILLGLVALGLLVRLVAGGGATGAVLYQTGQAERPHRDSVVAQAARLARPLAVGETVDVDRAPAPELARLPRIGPALAGRIVADREANGPFGSMQALDRVPGVGPGVLAALRPHIRFSARSRRLESGDTRFGKVRLNTATEEQLAQIPGIGPARARAIVDDRRALGPYRALEDLDRVRGIGPVTISRLKDLVIVP